jgi:hypothetical protein
MKTCNKCKIEKPFDAFGYKANIKSKLNGICKLCKVEYNQLRQFNMTTKMALEITKNCQSCGKDISSTKVCIDHDHETGIVRGILCNSCNVGIGLLGDSVEGLERAIRYLTNPPMPSWNY